MITKRALVAVLFTLALVTAGCSSSSGSDAGSSSPDEPSEPSGVDAAKAYAERGPFEVGTQQLTLDDGRRVVQWYPAVDGAEGEQQEFLIAELLSPALQEEVPDDLEPVYEIDATIDAEGSADGPFPIVLFNHGSAAYPEQSSNLTTHLASWGFVVVAPEQVEFALAGVLGTAAEGIEPREASEALSASLDLALADAAEESSPLNGLLDADLVAVTGHSAGAGAAYAMSAEDDRIDAFIAYSIGTGRTEDADGNPIAPRPVPDVPGMVMAGSTDGIIDASASKEVYEGMSTPKYYVELADAGHLVFSDICLVGRDQGGLLGLIDAAGLDLPENILRLAADGCEPGDLDPAEAFGAINHFSVAFLRSSFGIDAEPVGLTQEAADAYQPVEITLESAPS